MDFKFTLAGVLIAGGALGVLLPDQGGPGRSAASEASISDAAPRDARYVASAQTLPGGEPGWSEPVTLYREADGHFYAEVTVDGQLYRMLVDTGASVVALTGEDADRMGIAWDPAELAPIARGAGGPIEGVATTIERISLGGIEASRVAAIIIPEGSGISLLGQSFLTNVGKVEIAEDRMILGS